MPTPIVETTQENWQLAQKGELAFWQGMEGSRHPNLLRRFIRKLRGIAPSEGDDWNHWWAAKFNNYAVLPNHFENVLEVGCGPHTNLRVILENRKAHYIHCSDPLAQEYLQLRESWLSRQYHAGAVQVDFHPLEQCPFASDYFDLVVMNNVLDHVQSATRCLEQAVRVTAPCGYLVIGQDLCAKEEAPANLEGSLHPIRVTHDVLDVHLSEFKRVFFQQLSREEARSSGEYGVYLFIGQKPE